MTTQIVVPALGESIIEATVGSWLKREGDPVGAGETLVELETDKVNLEVAAERQGVLVRIERKEGEDVRVGDVLGILDESTAGSANNVSPEIGAKTDQPLAQDEQPDCSPIKAVGQATPLAKRMAAAQEIRLEEVSGSGPGGRVTKEDVERHLQTGRELGDPSSPEPAPTAPPAAAAPQPKAEPGRAKEPREKREPMSRRRQTIARRLLEATQTTAMLTTFNEIDMSQVVTLRKRWRDVFKEKHGVGLGFMSFFVKATVGALKAFPMINAEIQGDEIVLKQFYDIGIAIGAPQGLVVPVLRDADQMTFAQIEQAIDAYVGKTRDDTLSLEDLRGGTFTITNGGVFGSLFSTPILNPPQVGILGMHKIEERPIALGGEVVVRPMMYVALSYDHRIVDGQEAVLFLVRVKELIEDPEALLLEG